MRGATGKDGADEENDGASGAGELGATGTNKGWFAPDAHVIDEDPLSASGKSARWKYVLPAAATHACIGSPYAWSAVSSVLTREHGFVVSAASDWTFAETTVPLQD